MKRITKYFSLGLLLGSNILHGGTCCNTSCGPTVHTSFVAMTCGQNLYTQYHKLLFPGGDEQLNDMDFDYADDDCNRCKFVADLSATYRFIQSRNGNQIANYLWGSNPLVFQGSEVAGTRGENALVAEYFGLGPDTNLTAGMCPRIRNQVVDLQLELSGEKVWFQVNFPLMWSKWQATKSCGGPNVAGSVGINALDSGTVSLQFPIPAPGSVVAGSFPIIVNGTALSGNAAGAPANSVWFDSAPQGADKTNSIVAALNDAGALSTASDNSTNVQNISGLTYINTIATDGTQVTGTGTLQVGVIPMGTYGAYTSDAAAEYTGVLAINSSVADVPAINNLVTALGGDTAFGVFSGRKLNNFNFSPCGQFGLADIPMMLGYDFCKSDAYHMGLYVKFVIPTGTKINSCFLENVLTPVIGNGRHFELGIGYSAHANFLVCDTSGWGLFTDGYITRMFGACQTRTFDLPGQAMSRYALAFPINGDATAGYTVDSSQMVAIGDINLYNGNVSATRGELMVELIYSNCNWEAGLGYALAAQSAESISCDSCTSIASSAISSSLNGPSVAGYGIVGGTLQNQVGVATILPANTDYTAGYVTQTLAGTGPFTTGVQFFNLGGTNELADIPDGQSAAYVYGDSMAADSAYFAQVGDFSGNCSGLMARQVLNRIFAHIDYVWRDCAWQPELGIVGSIGFSPCSSVTAAYWDLGGRVGFAF